VLVVAAEVLTYNQLTGFGRGFFFETLTGGIPTRSAQYPWSEGGRLRYYGHLCENPLNWTIALRITL
jgi:hypothetical protein